ncbi:hypothetical protein L211DRAFT_840309 [Terfezia boudieri ATCC MYA-4762]|uniref:Uncharacterized protein n=1 Tax=Terfezia boudieri ATCC MYA-4762 TaxID=1051890 RepID=A0A3N4LFN0_9PEZI|nr:hypothetical protein L211DRAFT_840309 [Terfezia boudieri ATCC MYA-4762]
MKAFTLFAIASALTLAAATPVANEAMKLSKRACSEYPSPLLCVEVPAVGPCHYCCKDGTSTNTKCHRETFDCSGSGDYKNPWHCGPH